MMRIKYIHKLRTLPIHGQLIPITQPTQLYSSSSKYVPPEQTTTQKNIERLPPYPKVGDIVRYMDLDGGKIDGQILVGKITFIQAVSPSSTSTDNEKNKDWQIEILELDDVGDDYFAEYPSRERNSRKTLRNLSKIAPISASYVRTEAAYKIPFSKNTDTGVRAPTVRFDSYRVDGYGGPADVPINKETLESDGERYDKLKGTLIRDAALIGAFGTILVQFFKGTEDALIYAIGAAAGAGYLFFLSLKTDTLGTTNMNFGKNISNFRFLLPVLVLVSVSIKNILSSPVIELDEFNFFNTVTPEQFGAAMIGFLSYRLPLLVRQLQPVATDSVIQLIPGSAGVVIQQMGDAKKTSSSTTTKTSSSTSLVDEELIPVLLISGPSGTGKTTLVNELIKRGNGKFVKPILVDKVDNGAKFEVMEKRGEFLQLEKKGRYGLTIDSILNAVPKNKGSENNDVNVDQTKSDKVEKVVVVDASVGLAKKLTQISRARLIGIWIGLDTLGKFQSRFKSMIADGSSKIPREESEESFIRGKMQDVVTDIEYGVVSGVFEFTILNDDIERSIKELEEAAEYCFL